MAEVSKEAVREGIRTIRTIGEGLGYGNLMFIVSALWAEDAKERYGYAAGAFIPTPSRMIKKEALEPLMQERQRFIDKIAEDSARGEEQSV